MEHGYFKKLLNPKIALLLVLLVYLSILLSTYLVSFFPGGVDTSAHLFMIWLFQEEGFTAWNHWWYAGNPQLEQYPPLTHLIPSLFSPLAGIENSYKITFSLLFLFLPISFYYFLKELNLTPSKKSVALYFFSFSAVFVHFLQGGVFSFLASIPFLILFFKFLLSFINSGNIKSGALSSIFLAITALSHLFAPIGGVILISIYIFSFHRDAKSIKRFLLISILSFLLVSFYWVPLYLNYQIHGASSASLDFSGLLLNLIKLPIEFFGRTLSAYFNIISLISISLFMLLFVFYFYNSLKCNKKDQWLFAALLIAVPILLVLFAPLSGAFKTRFPLIFPIFFSIIVANVFNISKRVNYLIFALLFLMFISVVLHPVSSVPYEVLDLSTWASALTEERALFLPQGFGLLTYNETKPDANEYLYPVYLFPVYSSKEVYNGWFGNFAPHSEKDSEIAFICAGSRGYDELLSEISLFGKTILAKRHECKISTNENLFCEIIQDSSIDTIFVNSFFPEVKEYVENAPCFESIGSYKTLLAYKVINSKPYVDHDFNYEKNSGTILIKLIGPLEENITIRESYYPHWIAYLDSEEITVYESEGNFISVPVSIPEGMHDLKLVHSPVKFNNLFLFLSSIMWVLSILVLINPKIAKPIIQFI